MMDWIFNTGWEFLGNLPGFLLFVLFASLVGGPIMWLIGRNRNWTE